MRRPVVRGTHVVLITAALTSAAAAAFLAPTAATSSTDLAADRRAVHAFAAAGSLPAPVAPADLAPDATAAAAQEALAQAGLDVRGTTATADEVTVTVATDPQSLPQALTVIADAHLPAAAGLEYDHGLLTLTLRMAPSTGAA